MTTSGFGSAVDDLSIELPSWAFGNSGTRFRVMPPAGTARAGLAFRSARLKTTPKLRDSARRRGLPAGGAATIS